MPALISRTSDHGATASGLAACDGPGDFQLPYEGDRRQFYGYSARGPVGEPDGRDDGTLTPSAALGSLPFAPEVAIPAAQAMMKRPGLFDTYGFKDSFNPSFTYDVKVETGTVDRQTGWVAADYLGIDQGPILLQAANYDVERAQVFGVSYSASEFRALDQKQTLAKDAEVLNSGE